MDSMITYDLDKMRQVRYGGEPGVVVQSWDHSQTRWDTRSTARGEMAIKGCIRRPRTS